MKAEYRTEFSVASGCSVSRAKLPVLSDPLGILAGILSTVLLLVFFSWMGFEFSLSLPLSILLSVTGSCFLVVSLRSSRDPFSPVVIISAYFLLNIAFRTLYLSVSPSAHRLGQIGYDDYLPPALWCALLAYSSFWVGFHSNIGKRLRAQLPAGEFEWPATVPFGRILFLLSIATLSTLYLLKSGVGVRGLDANSGGPQPSAVFVALAHSVTICLVIALIYRFTRLRVLNRKLLRPLLLLSIASIVLYIAVTGGKQALFEPVIQAAIVIHYTRRRLAAWQLAVVALPVIMLGFGVLNFYRFAVAGQATTARGISDVVSRLSTAASRISEGETGDKSAFDQMLGREHGADCLALVLKLTPDPQPFNYGRSIPRAIAVATIPRVIWPDKPTSEQSPFERNYLGRPAAYHGAISTHLVPDLYINFSYVGVVIGMLVVGVLCKALYLFCAPGPNNLLGVFCYAVILPNLLHYMENEVGTNIVIVVHILAPMVAAAIFIGVRYIPRRSQRLSKRNGTYSPATALV